MHIILDIDGVLADFSHRKPLLDKGDWDAFIDPVQTMKDIPIPGAQKAMEKLMSLKADIQIISARFEAQRDATTRWLLEHFNFEATDFNMLLRPKANLLTASDAKIQNMQTQVAEYKNTRDANIIFIDNDESVFAAYAAEGVVLRAPECWSILFPEVTKKEE